MIVPLARPLLGLSVLLAIVVFCEARDASLVPALEAVYAPLAGPVAAVDLLLALVAAGTALELSRRRLPVLAPGWLTLPLALLALALAGGVVTGYARGAGPVDILYAGRYVAYVIVVPILVVNLVRTRREVVSALAFGAALAIGKAVLGLLTVGTGRGRVVEGATITFYEPVANWVMLVCLLGVLAALLHGLRDRLPLWALLGAPVMFASLALSLRRSFWIGLVLGVGLVLVLGTSPLARRLLAPAVIVCLAAGWALWSLGFQADGRLATRAETLKPSRIEASAQDLYRFAEQANVLAEIGAHPIAGLGLAVPWSSRARPLPVEHENGRQYVHTVGPVVLAQARRAGLRRLLRADGGSHRHGLARVAGRPRPARAGGRARRRLRPGGAGGDRDHRQLHRRRAAIHAGARGDARPHRGGVPAPPAGLSSRSSCAPIRSASCISAARRRVAAPSRRASAGSSR